MSFQKCNMARRAKNGFKIRVYPYVCVHIYMVYSYFEVCRYDRVDTAVFFSLACAGPLLACDICRKYKIHTCTKKESL